jgi:hypothetical protein
MAMTTDVQPDVIVGPPAANDADCLDETHAAILDDEAERMEVPSMAAMEILRTVARWRYSCGA